MKNIPHTTHHRLDLSDRKTRSGCKIPVKMGKYHILGGVFVLLFLCSIINSSIQQNYEIFLPIQTNNISESDDSIDNLTNPRFSADAENDNDDEDGDNLNDLLEEDNQRAIQIDYSNSEVQIESERKVESLSQDKRAMKDKFLFKMKAESNGITMEFKFISESNMNSIPDIFKISQLLQIQKIMEYIDNNQDGVYSEETDSELQTKELQSFSPIQYTKQSGNNNTIIHQFTLSSSDGIFTLIIFITEEFITLSRSGMNQTILSPNQVKLDFQFRQFPFQSTNSRLNLDIRFQSTSQSQSSSASNYQFQEDTEDEMLGITSNEEAINFTDNAQTAFFSWEKSAIVNNITQTLQIALKNKLNDEDSSYSLLRINYPQGSTIIHDPRWGISGILGPNSPIPPPRSEMPQSNRWLSWPFLFLWIFLGIVITFGLLMSKEEYRHYLLNRIMTLDTGVHELSMEDVLENQIRNNLLNLIIDNPGIHYKELLRQSSTSPSNLAWHLDILETYKVIHKARVGHFLIFYPFLDKNPFAQFDYKIMKSKLTLEIFQVIGDNPGINQKHLARRIDLNRKTLKYHLDKLEAAHLIKVEKSGRQSLVYPNALKSIEEPVTNSDESKEFLRGKIEELLSTDPNNDEDF